jgi:hypothetical protein
VLFRSVQALLNRLDPHSQWRRDCFKAKRENRKRVAAGKERLARPERPSGVSYIHRFRRLKRYEDTCPEASKRRIWVERRVTASGTTFKPHTYVDVRGVCYLTEAGRKVLGGVRGSPDAAHDIHRRGRRRRLLVAGRLRRGHALIGGKHVPEVLEKRRELQAAPDVPKNLSPSYPLPESSKPS